MENLDESKRNSVFNLKYLICVVLPTRKMLNLVTSRTVYIEWQYKLHRFLCNFANFNKY